MKIELIKHASNYLGQDRLESQIERILTKVNEFPGWKVSKTGPTLSTADNNLSYRCTLDLTSENPRNTQQLLATLKRASSQLKWVTQTDPSAPLAVEGNVHYSELTIPANWKANFNHLYGLNDQIDIVMSSIQAALDSHWQNRYHCALVGPPSCGKTETARSFKTLFGDESVLEYDATTTTMAGAIKDLAGRETLPRLLIVEEIEKADEQAFRWLLAVMDWRAEIRKVTARQSIQREVRMLAIVTVNDYQHFAKIMSGALASRCGDPIFFPQPSRATLKRILEREVKKVKGDPRWIEPALQYSSEMNITDPRHVAAICLRGKNNLLDGSFQKKLRSARMPQTLVK